MIKCDVTVCALISRTAEVKEGKNGSFLAFSVKYPLVSRDGEKQDMFIDVTMDGDKGSRSIYTAGRRVKIKGSLYPKKRGDKLYFNLRAEENQDILVNTTEEDSMEGTISFKGKVSKNEIISRNDSRGKHYISFDAFSSEDNNGTKEYIWVRFLWFDPYEGHCVAPSALISAEGKLQMNLYKGNIKLECIVSDVSEWTINK